MAKQVWFPISSVFPAGLDTETDPVDPELRLRGVSGLRVADASVIPWTPVSALNAPSMLIGYRASKLLQVGARRG